MLKRLKEACAIGKQQSRGDGGGPRNRQTLSALPPGYRVRLGFYCKEQAVTDIPKQSGMIRSVLLEAHSGPRSIKQDRTSAESPGGAGNQSRDWQPGLEAGTATESGRRL